MKYCPNCRDEMTMIQGDGVNRLSCSSTSCHYVYYDNPVPVVAAIVELNGEVILARNTAWPEGIFALITGFLEKGETPDEGVGREVQEELGLEVLSVEFIGYYSFFEMNQLLLAYHVRAQGEIKLSPEIAEIKRIPPEKLKPWPFGTGPAVKDWLATKRL